LEKWELALELNEQILAIQEAGTPTLELAKIQINSAAPLIATKRFSDARRILNLCREVFEGSDAIAELGFVFSHLANLEHATGNMADAIRFQKTALRYHYLIPNPHICAESHGSLAYLLVDVEEHPLVVLSHRLAYAMIKLRINNLIPEDLLPVLASDILRLFRYSHSDGALSFATLCDIVERVEGVVFRDLWASLPERQSTTDEQWFELVLAEVREYIDSRLQS
jgi:hypothetical protein